jgi:hypothetical protein
MPILKQDSVSYPLSSFFIVAVTAISLTGPWLRSHELSILAQRRSAVAVSRDLGPSVRANTTFIRPCPPFSWHSFASFDTRRNVLLDPGVAHRFPQPSQSLPRLDSTSDTAPLSSTRLSLTAIQHSQLARRRATPRSSLRLADPSMRPALFRSPSALVGDHITRHLTSRCRRTAR